MVAYFLRAQLTEPTRTTPSYSARMTPSTYNVTGNGTTTTYTVPNTPLCCVTAVTVAAAPQTEYVDYVVDIENNQVVFTTAPANLAAIVINYRHGTNWIWSDETRDEIVESSYPRIVVIPLDEAEVQKTGLGETQTYDRVLVQIDVLSLKNAIVTVDGVAREGSQVTTSIARSIVQKIRTNTEAKIGAKLFQPRVLGKRQAPFEAEYGVHRHIIEVQYQAFNAGD